MVRERHSKIPSNLWLVAKSKASATETPCYERGQPESLNNLLGVWTVYLFPQDAGFTSRLLPREGDGSSMVKLDVTCMRHLSKHDIRVLTAVEVSRVQLRFSRPPRHFQ